VKCIAAIFAALACLALVSGAARADISYSGGTSHPGSSLALGGSGWTPTFSWTVSQNVNGSWHYSYTTGTGGLTVSHFILETSDNFTSSDMWNISETGTSIMSWTSQNGSPGMPDSIYGIGFPGGSASQSFSFDSNRAPVWGNMYLKQSESNYAWNAGFTSDASTDADENLPLSNGSVDNLLPEPASLVLGLCTLGGVLRRRRSRR
jgi:hypothetical protein